MKHFFAIFLILSVLLQGQTWHCPESTVRILAGFTDAAHPADALVPIPQELSDGMSAVAAFAADGSRLSASPVIIAGKLSAATVAFPKGTQEAAIYLLPSADKDAPPFSGFPVHIQRTSRDLTTRAHSAEEMLRMFDNLHLISFPQSQNKPRYPVYKHASLKAFGVFSKKTESWATAHPAKGHSFMRAFTCSTAAFAVDAASACTVAADQSQVAWTILIDGIPAANWTNEGMPLPKELTLQPGLHTMQLLAAQSVNEPMPKPVITLNGKPFTAFLPAMRPTVLGIELKNTPAQTCRATLLPGTSYSFNHSAASVRLYDATIPQGTAVEFLGADGNPLPSRGSADKRSVLAANGFAPAIRFNLGEKAFTFPGLTAWTPCTALPVSLHLRVPWLQDANKPLDMTAITELPVYFPAELKPLLKLYSDQSPDGIPCISSRTSLSLPISRGQKAVTIRLCIGTVPVCTATSLALVFPEKADTPLRAQGDQLFLNDGTQQPAVLLIANSAAAASNPAPAGTVKAALFDDGILTRLAPQADLLPPELIHVPAGVPTGTDPVLAMPASLHKLLRLRPEKAFIVVTPHTFNSQPDMLKGILGACTAFGIQPVLVTLPAIPDNPLFNNGRDAARNLKSLACDMGIDCLDLYTQALLDNVSASQWDSIDGVRISTLNNDARRWLYSFMR